MKRLLFLMTFSLLSFAGFGQSVTQLVNPSGNTLSDPDTISGSATTYLKARAYGGSTINIQLNIVKISGTVGGYALVQASVDNNSVPVMWANVTTDTLTLANGDNCKIWSLHANYLHYRVKIVSSGTQVFAPKAFYYLKP